MKTSFFHSLTNAFRRAEGLVVAMALSGGTFTSQALTSVDVNGSTVAPAQLNPAAMLSPGARDILRMVRAKVAPEVIKTYIKSAMTPFNLGANDIIALKDQGVPDDVLAAMLQRGGELRGQYAQQSQPQMTQPMYPPTVAPASPVPDYGYGYDTWPYTDYGYPYYYPSASSFYPYDSWWYAGSYPWFGASLYFPYSGYWGWPYYHHRYYGYSRGYGRGYYGFGYGRHRFDGHSFAGRNFGGRNFGGRSSGRQLYSGPTYAGGSRIYSGPTYSGSSGYSRSGYYAPAHNSFGRTGAGMRSGAFAPSRGFAYGGGGGVRSGGGFSGAFHGGGGFSGGSRSGGGFGGGSRGGGGFSGGHGGGHR